MLDPLLPVAASLGIAAVHQQRFHPRLLSTPRKPAAFAFDQVAVVLPVCYRLADAQAAGKSDLSSSIAESLWADRSNYQQRRLDALGEILTSFAACVQLPTLNTPGSSVLARPACPSMSCVAGPNQNLPPGLPVKVAFQRVQRC